MITSVCFSETTVRGLPVGWGMTFDGILGKKTPFVDSGLAGSNIIVSKPKATAIFALSFTATCLGVAIAVAAIVGLLILGGPLTLPLIGAAIIIAAAGVGIACLGGYVSKKANNVLSQGDEYSRTQYLP